MQPPDAPSIARHEPAPDRQANFHDIACPMCDYNLRGLIEPRCPECGYRFEWAELQDARRSPHRYLFEHHPAANFKSFWKTAWGGLNPSRFWKELHPAMPSRPGRLLAYWLLAMLCGAAAVTGYGAYEAKVLAVAARQERARATVVYSPISADPNFLPSFLDREYPLPPSRRFFDWLWKRDQRLRVAVILLGLLAAWPWATFGTLMIFRVSMRRARVRPVHVLRCVLYSYDAILWLGIILAIVIPLYGLAFTAGPPPVTYPQYWSGTTKLRSLVPYYPAGGSLRGFPSMIGNFMPLSHSLLMALLVFGTLRLLAAYRLYLRFDWPWTTVLASQVILILVLAIIALNVYGGDVTWYWRRLIGM
jgi:hypothetical protein